MVKGVILAILCSIVSLTLHLIVCIFRKGRIENEPLIFELFRQVKLILSIWLLSLLIYTWLFFSMPDIVNNIIKRFNSIIELTGFVYGIFLYLILSFTYLSFYYLVDRSVSATILEIIENSPTKKLSQEEIKKIYDVEKKYQKELKGMIEGGFIFKELNYYKNSLKGRLYARMVKFMKRFLKLGPGG